MLLQCLTLISVSVYCSVVLTQEVHIAVKKSVFRTRTAWGVAAAVTVAVAGAVTAAAEVTAAAAVTAAAVTAATAAAAHVSMIT